MFLLVFNGWLEIRESDIQAGSQERTIPKSKAQVKSTFVIFNMTNSYS
jgi:hypothetical protein